MIPGAHPKFVPAETAAYLQRKGLLVGRSFHFHAFSKGALDFGHTCKVLRSNGATTVDDSVVLYAPAGDPAAIKWPHPDWLPSWALPVTLIVLQVPPLIHLMKVPWVVFWLWKERQCRRIKYHRGVEHAKWCRNMHAGTVIRGARALMRETGLKAADFAGIARRRIIVHEDDYLVGNSDLWLKLLDADPDTDVLTLPGRDHGGFTENQERIRAELAGMYTIAA